MTETERKIKEIFKSKMEELAFQSSGGGTDSHGNPMTVESFWADAGNIFNEALDSLIALKEYS